MKKREMTFGEFLNKYGEMIAYGGLLFIVFIIGIIPAAELKNLKGLK